MTDEKMITLDHERLTLAAQHIHYGAQMLLAMLIDAGAVEVAEAKSDEPELACEKEGDGG